MMRTRALAGLLAFGFAAATLPALPVAAKGKKSAKKLFKKANKAAKKKKWDKAIKLYRKAASLAPGVGAIHVNLARAYKGAGSCGPSLLHFGAYLALNKRASDRALINDERRECVESLGDVSRLSVRVGDDDAPAMGLVANGVPLGETPLSGLILAAGDYILEVTPRSGSEKTHEITLKAAEGTELVLGPNGDVAPAMLSFSIKPDGMTVKLDGEEIGTSPIEDAREVSSGKHKVVITDPKGALAEWKGTVTVGPGEEETVEAELEAVGGHLVVQVGVPGAKAIIDGEPVELDKPIPLSTGAHKVQVAAKGFKTWKRKVRIKEGRTRQVMVNLEELGGSLDGMKIGAYAAGGTGALALVLGAVFGTMALSQHGEIEDRILSKRQFASGSELDEIEGKQMTANVLYVTSVVALGTAAALWLMGDDSGAEPVK